MSILYSLRKNHMGFIIHYFDSQHPFVEFWVSLIIKIILSLLILYNGFILLELSWDFHNEPFKLFFQENSNCYYYRPHYLAFFLMAFQFIPFGTPIIIAIISTLYGFLNLLHLTIMGFRFISLNNSSIIRTTLLWTLIIMKFSYSFQGLLMDLLYCFPIHILVYDYFLVHGDSGYFSYIVIMESLSLLF